MDIWNPAIGIGCCNKYSHFATIVVKIPTNNHKRIMRIQILERALDISSVHDEIKNILYNHTNPLAAEVAVTNRQSRRLHMLHPIFRQDFR